MDQDVIQSLNGRRSRHTRGVCIIRSFVTVWRAGALRRSFCIVYSTIAAAAAAAACDNPCHGKVAARTRSFPSCGSDRRTKNDGLDDPRMRSRWFAEAGQSWGMCWCRVTPATKKICWWVDDDAVSCGSIHFEVEPAALDLVLWDDRGS